MDEKKKAEKKAKLSRKSAAYHAARKAALEDGCTEEEAKEKAKDVPVAALSYIVYCSAVYLKMHVHTYQDQFEHYFRYLRPTKPLSESFFV